MGIGKRLEVDHLCLDFAEHLHIPWLKHVFLRLSIAFATIAAARFLLYVRKVYQFSSKSDYSSQSVTAALGVIFCCARSLEERGVFAVFVVLPSHIIRIASIAL